ncbi:unnamed protein product [Lampetra fluviatilis]
MRVKMLMLKRKRKARDACGDNEESAEADGRGREEEAAAVQSIPRMEETSRGSDPALCRGAAKRGPWAGGGRIPA